MRERELKRERERERKYANTSYEKKWIYLG